MSVIYLLMLYIKLAMLLLVGCFNVAFTIVRVIGKKFWFAAKSIFADI